MNKKLMVTMMAVSAIFLTSSFVFAEEQNKDILPVKPEYGAMEMKSGLKDASPIHHRIRHHQGPSKAEMEAKKVEFEKRLQLTDEQKKKIEEQRIQDHAKMKPVFEEMRAKKHEIRKIDFDTTLTPEQKEVKKGELRGQIKELKTTADTYREENMKNFESVLTKKQQKEFSKIREEQKQEMEKRRTEFKKMKKEREKFFPPVQPKPQPIEK